MGWKTGLGCISFRDTVLTHPAFRILRRFRPGFFYLTNHGLEKQRDEMFRLCEESFKTVPIEEKEAINMTRAGIYMGWKPLTGETSFSTCLKWGLGRSGPWNALGING